VVEGRVVRMSDWTSTPAPGGVSLNIRDVEFGISLVTVGHDVGGSWAFGVEPAERKAAAQALAGDQYVVVRKERLRRLFDENDTLREPE
jgi:predicted alpha/beta hydrolase